MKADIAWITEDLLQRKVPRVVEPDDHGCLLLPIRRNRIDDGYVFVVRLSSGGRRPREGSPPRPKLYSFERWVAWSSSQGPQESILMAHSLFPVRTEVLKRRRGHANLNEGQARDCERFLAGLLWDSEAALAQLPAPSSAELVPPLVRTLEPGSVIVIDGSPAVVVSNSTLHARHHLGTLALVPLIQRSSRSAADAVHVGSLVAAPELLKICQPFDELQDTQSSSHRLAPAELEALQQKLRALLTWAEEPDIGSSKRAFVTESEHPCLFSTNPRPWEPRKRPRQVQASRYRKASGATESFAARRLDSARWDGSEGTLRMTLWDRQGEVSIQLVAVGERLPIIDMLSVLSEDQSIDIARGPLVPSNGIVVQRIGALSAIQGKVVEVAVRAPGIAGEYTFQIVLTTE